MSAKIEWPERIYMPRPGEFTIGVYKNGRGQCCLVGWARRSFSERDDACNSPWEGRYGKALR